ncbi:ABC transporter permease [Micromonosporaceae bacterium Da 78-11]
MTTFTATKLVAARELKMKLRDKTFLFTTVFFLLFAVASGVLPGLLAGGPAEVAVSDQGSVAALRAAGLDVRTVPDQAAAEQLVRDGEVDAAVVAGPRIVALQEEPASVISALSSAPPVQLLEPSAVNPFLAFIVPFALAFIFFLTSLLFGLQIAQSVTEEKQTRIVEILVSSVPVRALLAGKVAALSLLSFAQVLLIALVSLIGARLAGLDSSVLRLLEPAVGWFIPFFALGFLMLAALWAGVGALSARLEDINGVSMPLQMAVMLPFFAVIFLSDNDPAMKVLSYIPFSSPVAMPVRLFTGDAAGWEPFLALGILAVTTVALLAVGARLYEGSLLRTNGRTAISTAWRTRATAG